MMMIFPHHASLRIIRTTKAKHSETRETHHHHHHHPSLQIVVVMDVIMANIKRGLQGGVLKHLRDIFNLWTNV
jgi:hypothetical protein